MVFVLGTDEAGYGPNLGPLCVAASAWQLPSRAAAECMYEQLAAVVAADPDGVPPRLAIADSKRLYKPGGTLELLERGVLTALALLDRLPRCWREVWQVLDGPGATQLAGCPWHEGFDEELPLHATAADLRAAAAALAEGCRQCGTSLRELRAAVVFPAEFNRAVAGCDNKAEVLSLTTLRLAERVLAALPAGPAIVFCDKHGGRNRYAALLQHVFADELVVVRHESPALSRYEVRQGGRRIEFRFQPKGEQHLPTALASMTAKYLRELAMRPFNAFWQRQVPGLRPTAGYPADARRFWEEIQPAQQRLGIAAEVVWRER